MSFFTIDFFELAFLAEACVPPSPIARVSFFQKLTNVHYENMSTEERNHLFNWITKNRSFDKSNNDCLWFYNRFNPDNQYTVFLKFEKEEKKVSCFKHGEDYYTKINYCVNPECVIKIEKKSA